MPERDPWGPLAHGAGSLHVLPGSEAERLASDQPGRAHPGQQGEHQDEQQKCRPEYRRQVDEKVHDRHGKDHVDDAHEDGVGEAAQIAGDRAIDELDRVVTVDRGVVVLEHEPGGLRQQSSEAGGLRILRREQVQVRGESRDQQQAEEVGGHRVQDDGNPRRQVVHRPAAAHGLQEADGDLDEEREHERCTDEERVVRQILGN